MSDSRGTLEAIARHLVLALKPLQQGVSSLDEFQHLMARLGWNAQSIPVLYASLATQVDGAIQALETLPDSPSEEDIIQLLGKAKGIYQAVQAISVAPPGVDAGAFLSEIRERLFELLLTEYLASDLPTVYNLGLVLQVVEIEHVPSSPTRPAVHADHLHWDRIPAIVDDPLSLLAIVYGWGTPKVNYIRILEHLSELLVAVRLPVQFHGTNESLSREYSDVPESPFMGSRLSLRMPFFYATVGGVPTEFALSVHELLKSGDKLPGLIIEPDVPSSLPLSFPLGDSTDLQVRAGSDIASQFGILVRPGEISVKYPFQAGQQMPKAGFGLAVDFHPSQPRLLLGSAGDTRLELTGGNVGLQVNEAAGEVELIVSAEAKGLALILAAGDGDSFLNDLLGSGEKHVDVPLGAEWSSTRGFHFKGGGGFDLELPVHLQLGPVVVDAVQIRLLRPQEPGPRARLELGASVTGKLGPLTATVQGIGFKVDLRFADGNAGPFDVGLGFKWPTGVGLR